MTGTPANEDWDALLRYLEANELPSANGRYLSSAQVASSIELLRQLYPGQFTGDLYRASLAYALRRMLCQRPRELVWQWHAAHAYAEITRRVSGLPGWRLLAQRLRSDRGFESQLFATFFLLEHHHVQSIEGSSDIKLADGEEIASVEVKSLDQAAKSWALIEAFGSLSTAVDVKGIKNRAAAPLAIVLFDGVLPLGMDGPEFVAAFGEIPIEAGTKRVDLGAGCSVQVEFAWGATEGHIAGVNSLRNFQDHLSQVEQLAAAGQPMSLFLGVVPLGTVKRMSSQYLQTLSRELNSRGVLGVLFLEWGPGVDRFHFRRSRLVRTRHTTRLIDALEESLPSECAFPY